MDMVNKKKGKDGYVSLSTKLFGSLSQPLDLEKRENEPHTPLDTSHTTNYKMQQQTTCAPSKRASQYVYHIPLSNLTPTSYQATFPTMSEALQEKFELCITCKQAS